MDPMVEQACRIAAKTFFPIVAGGQGFVIKPNGASENVPAKTSQSSLAGVTALASAPDKTGETAAAAATAVAAAPAAVAAAPVLAVGSLIGGLFSLFSDDDEKELTVQQASEVLGISTYTIKRKIANHEISATKKGNKFMITNAELKRYSAATKKSGLSYGAVAEAISKAQAIQPPSAASVDPDSPADIKKLLDILKDAVTKKDLEIEMAELEEEEPGLSDEQKRERKKEVLNLKIEKTDLEANVKMMELRLEKLRQDQPASTD